MYNQKLKFKNNKFIIMQVSDAQDMHIPRKAMFKMLDAAYDKVKPDLIILTGDNILGNHINDGLVGNKKTVKSYSGTLKRMKKAISYLVSPINKRNIPFAFIFGNHDDMNIISKEEQASIFGSYDFCIDYNKESFNCGTYMVPIYSSDGSKIAYNLWMVDSAGSDDKGNPSFNCVKKDILDWYKNKSIELENNNNGKVNSLMFQHVPVPDVKRLFIETDSEDKDSVYNSDNNKYYKLDRNLANGFAFEYPAVTNEDFGQLNVLKSRGDVCALVFGHDHLNNFTAEINSVNIVQTPGASFRSYGNLVSRSVRIFELDEYDTSVFNTYTIGYFDLFGKRFKSVLRYIFSADEYEKIKNLFIILAFVIILGIILYFIASLNLINRFLY